mmetsp:Transcript_6873/g.19453  ORF Transcript_6873/g.19453 Transcript_6873/m.19453 type:complete len:214 (-) Transcript_6873:298-939(-)
MAGEVICSRAGERLRYHVPVHCVNRVGYIEGGDPVIHAWAPAVSALHQHSPNPTSHAQVQLHPSVLEMLPRDIPGIAGVQHGRNERIGKRHGVAVAAHGLRCLIGCVHIAHCGYSGCDGGSGSGVGCGGRGSRACAGGRGGCVCCGSRACAGGRDACVCCGGCGCLGGCGSGGCCGGCGSRDCAVGRGDCVSCRDHGGCDGSDCCGVYGGCAS